MNQYLKKIVPIILWGLTIPLAATPLPDKITVSHRYITVLIFESPVCAVNIASQDYAAKIQGNYLMLRCRKPKVE